MKSEETDCKDEQQAKRSCEVLQYSYKDVMYVCVNAVTFAHMRMHIHFRWSLFIRNRFGSREQRGCWNLTFRKMRIYVIYLCCRPWPCCQDPLPSHEGGLHHRGRSLTEASAVKVDPSSWACCQFMLPLNDLDRVSEELKYTRLSSEELKYTRLGFWRVEIHSPKFQTQ